MSLFGGGSILIDEQKVYNGTLIFNKVVSHGYGRTKSGKGTIKTNIYYEVYVLADDHIQYIYKGNKRECQREYKKYLKFWS